MKTLSARTLRVANLFTLAAALLAVCPRTTLAENGGPNGQDLPMPNCSFTDGSVITYSNVASQPDGSITYFNAKVYWVNWATHAAIWVNVSKTGALLFSDGTKGQI